MVYAVLKAVLGHKMKQRDGRKYERINYVKINLILTTLKTIHVTF
jgi:hypothetical protein